MVIYLQAVQIHGTVWKRKKLLKKEDVFKLIMSHLRLIGKLTKHFAAM